MYPVALPNGKTVKFETKEEIKEWVRTLQSAYIAAYNEECQQKAEGQIALLKVEGVEYVDWKKIHAVLTDYYTGLNERQIKLKVGRLQGAFLRVGAYTGGRVGFNFRCVVCGASPPTPGRIEFHMPDCEARFQRGYRHFIVSRASILDNETTFSELEDVPHIGSKTKDDYEVLARALKG